MNTKTKVPERTLKVREETFGFAVALVAHYTRFKNSDRVSDAFPKT